MSTTKIEYIGKKALKKDTVAGTNIVWNGPGDVQDVPNKAVAMLLAHTDSWALASGSKAPEGDGKNPEGDGSKAPEGDGKNPEGDGSKAPEGDGKNPMSEADAKPPMANLESMDGTALRAYAQQHFGHEFHHKAGEGKMRQTIIGLMNRG